MDHFFTIKYDNTEAGYKIYTCIGYCGHPNSPYVIKSIPLLWVSMEMSSAGADLILETLLNRHYSFMVPQGAPGDCRYVTQCGNTFDLMIELKQFLHEHRTVNF